MVKEVQKGDEESTKRRLAFFPFSTDFIKDLTPNPRDKIPFKEFPTVTKYHLIIDLICAFLGVAGLMGIGIYGLFIPFVRWLTIFFVILGVLFLVYIVHLIKNRKWSSIFRMW